MCLRSWDASGVQDAPTIARRCAAGHPSRRFIRRRDGAILGQRLLRGNAMKLSADQVREFEEQGYLFLPSVYSKAEMDLLNGEVPGLLAQDRPEVVREKGTTAPRTAFHVQTWNPVFSILARHPRLVGPGMQLLGSDKLYMHQFKINAKAAFDGAVWQWHQDYATWYEDGQMP